MSVDAPKVFISYRRRDAAGHAGRLYDAMTTRFDARNVFMDVDMAPGVDFVQRITEAVGACHVLIVVMGPRWAELIEQERGVGIREREDYVRLEVETALRRPDVTVIPVLVAGAQMPEPDTLPEGLRALARRNAIELSDMRWRSDVARLIDTLRGLLPGATIPEPDPVTPLPAPPSQWQAPPRQLRGPWFRRLLEGVLLAVAAAVVARALDLTLRVDPSSDDLSRIVDAVAWRAEAWTLVGGVLAAWLTLARGEPRDLASRTFAGLLVGALAGGLAGATYAVPRFLIDDLSPEEIHLIADSSYAVLGAILGGMVGALWIPRRFGIGFTVGAVAGFLQHALWINQGWEGKMLSVTLEAVVIFGAVLGILTALDALGERGSSTSPSPQGSLPS